MMDVDTDRGARFERRHVPPVLQGRHTHCSVEQSGFRLALVASQLGDVDLAHLEKLG